MLLLFTDWLLIKKGLRETERLIIDALKNVALDIIKALVALAGMGDIDKVKYDNKIGTLQ